MALIKLHRAMEEEDSDPLTPFFQWITINYTLSDRQKTVLLQKAIEKKKTGLEEWPSCQIESAIQEAQFTVEEVTKEQFMSKLIEEILRDKMPTAYYVQIDEMNIADM